MLYYFLTPIDAEKNKNLFKGLNIMKQKYNKLRERYQGQVPTIKLTFKNIKTINSKAELYKLFKEELSFLFN